MAVFSPVERRVDRLEDLMAELTSNVNRLSREMREFKEEMREFKEEMSEFKEEMRVFKDETQEENRRMNRRWGELANKMGTLAEDLVAPSIPRIMSEIVGCPEGERAFLTVRSSRRLPNGESREFDVIAGCGDLLLINETKTRLGPRDVSEFIQALERAREFLPEYADRKIVGALASFYVDPSVVTYGERAGLIMLGMADDVMTLLSTAELRLRWF
jgi:predicted RNase H-like nuclease (RuvC/YqgF family)